MKSEPAKAAYPSGVAVKPGDLVTGIIDAGSFPAEPFLAQVVFVAAGFGKAEVVFLKRRGRLNRAAALFKRQSRVAGIYQAAMVPVCGLSLRQRCSRPLSRDAAERMGDAPMAGGQAPRGLEWLYGSSPKAG